MVSGRGAILAALRRHTRARAVRIERVTDWAAYPEPAMNPINGPKLLTALDPTK